MRQKISSKYSTPMSRGRYRHRLYAVLESLNAERSDGWRRDSRGAARCCRYRVCANRRAARNALCHARHSSERTPGRETCVSPRHIAPLGNSSTPRVRVKNRFPMCKVRKYVRSYQGTKYIKLHTYLLGVYIWDFCFALNKNSFLKK